MNRIWSQFEPIWARAWNGFRAMEAPRRRQRETRRSATRNVKYRHHLEHRHRWAAAAPPDDDTGSDMHCNYSPSLSELSEL